jgi:hypothetical protein
MSKEAMLTAEVAVLTELVRVLSDKVNELQAKQEQGEPVTENGLYRLGYHNGYGFGEAYGKANPPQRTWVGLDEEDDIDWEEGGSLRDLVEAVEAKLRSKNT